MSLHILSLTHHVYTKLDEKAKMQAGVRGDDEESDSDEDDDGQGNQVQHAPQDDLENLDSDDDIPEDPKSYLSMSKNNI